MTDFEITEGKLAAVIVNGTERIPVQAAVAAIGHSARDTFEIPFMKSRFPWKQNLCCRFPHPASTDYDQ